MSKTLSGTLDTFSLADLLQWLEINALSGRVTVTRGDVKRTVDLKAGAIVFVSSSRQEERLGTFLAERGVLPESAMFELLAENFVTGRNLTRLILDGKLLPRERLAEAVETLAVQILLDLFHWTGATFDFDPLFRTEDILHIHLSLRGQVLAFHGVKSVDDSARIRIGAPLPADLEARWEKEFRPETLAGSFWSILESLPPDGAAPGAIRDRFYVFNLFADEVHKRLLEPLRPFPIYDDTAQLLQAALADGGDPERLVQIAALDPFLAANFLMLANALRLEKKELVGTAREACDEIGEHGVRRFASLLTGPAFPKTPSGDRLQRFIRRTALSTAVAASHLAESFGFEGETAYTLGLLEPLGGYDLLKALMTIEFQAGPFRGLALSHFRSVFGRTLARKLNLPRTHEDVLGCDGRVHARSAPSVQLVFFAKQMVPGEQIGGEWMSDDPELADRYASLAVDPGLPERIARDASMLHEIVNL
ncbi:MAG: DUF4388 domain-containing protein [Thermoanaerobaculia bacterium]